MAVQESGVLQILQDALEAQPELHPLVVKFDHLIDKDFVEFSRIEAGCDNLKAYIGLQLIKQRMQEIANFPEINSKTVIAVGGGFSAGKSSFINSLLDESEEQVQLATGTRPVTAVPSYLVHSSDQAEICGINYKNARFSIAASDYEELKHDSNRIGAIRVGSAIKYCTVKLKFKPDLIERCCLIDIPGYNPGTNDMVSEQAQSNDIDMGDEVDLSFLDAEPDETQTIDELNSSGVDEPNSDYNIAREAIAKADCLIWLFSLEHGPIPANDLEFLKKLGFNRNNKPLYFVGNKADVRTVSDIEACLNQTCETLKDAGIAFDGICAYSSMQGRVIKPKDDNCLDVFDYIRNNNKNKDIAIQLDQNLQAIFAIYFQKISDEVNFFNQVLVQLEDADRQGLIEGLFRPTVRSGLRDKLEDLKELFFQRRKMPSDLEAARQLKQKLSDCIHEFCSSLDLQEEHITETKYCIGCGHEIENDIDCCPFCHSLQDGTGRLCPKCGKLAPFEADFCAACGFNFNEE